MWWGKVICTIVVITLVRGQQGYDYPVQGGQQGYDYPVQGGYAPTSVRQNCPDSCERYYGGDQDPYYEQVCNYSYRIFFT